jgi:hypothetical protein
MGPHFDLEKNNHLIRTEHLPSPSKGGLPRGNDPEAEVLGLQGIGWHTFRHT